MRTNQILIAACSLCLAAVNAAAQKGAQPSPTPPDDVVRISTNLVQVDFTVTGRDGKPITDIRPDEVEVYDNGRKQNLTNLSFIAQQSAAPTAGRTLMDKGVALPTAPLKPGAVRRTIAIVVDDLTLSWESVYYTRGAIKKFIDEMMQEGDLVAIIRTGSSIGALQQFTNDKRLLYAALERIKYNPMGVGGVSALEAIKPNASEILRQSGLVPADARSDAFFAAAATQRKENIVAGVMGTIQYVVRGMGTLPGRKSAVLFSDGYVLFKKNADSEMLVSGDVMSRLRRLIDDANRGGVVIYPIDPRGLQPEMLTAADNTTGKGTLAVRSAVRGRLENMLRGQDGARFLADETGGFAVLNTNDISGGLRRVLDDHSYYLAGYIPEADSFNAAGKYNKLEVRVRRKGAAVRFRKGFVGYTDNKKNAPQTKASGPISFIGELQAASISPFASNGITVRLNSLFGSNADEASYVRSLLHIDAKDLEFTDEKDGSKSCAFDVLATSFGDNGQVVDQIGKRYSMTVTPDVYKKIQDEGFVYHFKFPVTKPGAYQYRVALRDSIGGGIGTASQFVQVPDLKRADLTLSSIALENMSVGEYQGTTSPPTDTMTDTAVRRIRVGRVYRYSLEIYNANLSVAGRPDLQTRVRVFREGKNILEGLPKPFDAAGQTDLTHLRFYAGLAIGSQMEPGDYVLEVIVTDNNRKGAVTSQLVEFEVIP